MPPPRTTADAGADGHACAGSCADAGANARADVEPDSLRGADGRSFVGPHERADGRTVTRTDDQADGRTVVRADSRSHTRAYFGSYGILGADGRADAVPERHVLEFRGTVRGVQRPSRGVQGLRVRRLHR